MGAVFGSGKKPGVLGTGQQQFKQYDVNQDVYNKNEQYDASRENLANRQSAVDARTTPNSTAAQTNMNDLYKGQLQNAQVSQASGVSVGQAAQNQAAQIGAANTSQNVNLGQAAQANAAQLNSQDAQFRNNQVALSNQLTNQMNGQGPSLAATQYQQAQEKNLAGQMGAAAAMGGRNAGLSQRNLAMNAAAQGQQTARDVANIRTQEQLNATSQLANVSQQGRDQDINLAAQNAQLQQQAALANQGATNQFALQQGSMNMQNNQFNAGALNDRQLQQAQLNQQSGLANQAATNQFGLTQAQMNMQNNQFNSQAQNNAYLQNAQLNAQNEANYGSQYNQTLGQNTQNQQQTNLANQQAEFQNRQQQDAMSQFYQGTQLQLDQNQQQAQMQYEALRAQQQQAQNNSEQAAYEAARQGQSALTGGLLGAAAGFVSSDREVKTSVKRGNEKVKDFMDSYMKPNTTSHSPAGGKNLGPIESEQPKEVKTVDPTTPTGTDTSNPATTKSKADLELQNRKYEAILKGMSSQSPTAPVPGFMGGFGAGISGGTQMRQGFNNLINKPKTEAPKGSTTQAFSGESDLGSNAGLTGAPSGGGGSSLFSSAQQGGSVSGGGGDFGTSSGGSPSMGETSDANKKNLSPTMSHSPAGGKNLGGGASMSSSGGGTSGMGGAIASKIISGDTSFLQPNPRQEGQKMDGTQPLSLQQKKLSGSAAPQGTSNLSMQLKNFGSAAGPTSSGQAPTTYDKINSDGSMDVMGSLANHNAAATAYAQPGGVNNYSDYPGMERGRAAGPGGASGTTGSASDEKVKTEVEPGDKKVKELMDSIHAYDYTYKEPDMPGRGHGRFVSPMAQELEKTELGRSAVKDTPNGKMVDYGKMLGAMLAADAVNNERLNKLEGDESKPPISKAEKKKK